MYGCTQAENETLLENTFTQNKNPRSHLSSGASLSDAHFKILFGIFTKI